MTTNPGRRSDAKRKGLIEAASALLHEQGFASTSLAQVAGRSGVPLGNLYYYFKSKEALAEAVIDAHAQDLVARFAAFEADHRDARGRLRALLRIPFGDRERLVRFGCPYGGLCLELKKLGPDHRLSQLCARLLGLHLDFAERQFALHGCPPALARRLACELVAAQQGALLLAQSLHSADLLGSQLSRLLRSLDQQLAATAPTRGGRARPLR